MVTMPLPPPRPQPLETFQLGTFVLPRLFTGLWQLSSNSWGSAPAAKVRRQMGRYVENGYTAFDMADHYGPAEILFGEFRERRTQLERAFGATKWCVFRQVAPTREVVEVAIQDRLNRMKTQRIDLLQFHWQNYADPGYFTALQHLQDLQHEGKISLIGLCNFDSERTDEICEALGPGSVVSNQVQFSLVDIRPLYGMAEVCRKHNLKLLTYGSLCGGFLSDTWLGKEEPDLYSGALTPSQRKYLDMIVKAWGSWALFQSLLMVLRSIADKYEGMSIANIATRWVLDYPFVGAVIIGARMGVSEHTDDNRKVYGFRLSAEDRAAIDGVLSQSNGARLIETIGDCGAEYR
ncbi:Aldo/keto reductase [Trametes gibbosa]|nr:Aldo/keto reductase [Trametes gibbosa]